MKNTRKNEPIAPIPAKYKGITFRSTLEARWAILFDCLGVMWQYEPEYRQVNGVGYLPDFWLPDYKSFVEVKPSIDGENIDKPIALATQQQTVIVAGQPIPSLDMWFGEPDFPSQVFRGRVGLCLNCKQMLVCARVNNQDATILAPQSTCRHRFLWNPDVPSFRAAMHTCYTLEPLITTGGCRIIQDDVAISTKWLFDRLTTEELNAIAKM